MHFISFKYAKVENDADKIWKFERYALVYEYYSKPILPAPFQIFSFFIMAFKYILLKCFFKNEQIKENSFKHILFVYSNQQEMGFGKRFLF